jgi:hypothetical protein
MQLHSKPDRSFIIFCFIPLVPLLLNLKWMFHSCRINEQNELKIGHSCIIDIQHIYALEEHTTWDVKVIYYRHFPEENYSVPIPVHDKDKERLITDLLSINPRIEVKQPLSQAYLTVN